MGIFRVGFFPGAIFLEPTKTTQVFNNVIMPVLQKYLVKYMKIKLFQKQSPRGVL